MTKEIEVFGISYDRYVLMNLHKIMALQLDLKKIVEMPSHGAKAAGSLYSIGFGLVGCHVTLVNPEMNMMYGWRELGIEDRVETISEVNVNNTPFREGEFDLAWNFVTWTELDNPSAYFTEMKRISKDYVLLVTCNNFQPGYPWHRLMHILYGFPWTHGQVKYNHINRVKTVFHDAGLKIVEYGAIDSPGWPDPLVPIRDIRLHKKFGGSSESPEWEVPIIQYVKTGQYPTWMRILGRWDMMLRKGVFKLPMSHLFYVLGRKKKSRIE
jgi:hypothetical protein